MKFASTTRHYPGNGSTASPTASPLPFVVLDGIQTVESKSTAAGYDVYNVRMIEEV